MQRGWSTCSSSPTSLRPATTLCASGARTSSTRSSRTVGSSEEPHVTLRLLNDTRERATVRGCDAVEDCYSTWMDRDVDPGLVTETSVPRDEVIEPFRVKLPGREETCLPVRVHDAVARYGAAQALVARLSQASACPGKTVLPRATEE